jgi:hypothetical protein
VWVAAVASGLYALQAYTATPGPTGPSPARWPADCVIPLSTTRPTIMLALHSRCPCSRATLDELEEVVRRRPGRLEVHVLFVQPHSRGPEWAQSDLWRRAGDIPGAVLWEDEGGREAKRFGAVTSGHVLAYGPSGDLLFSGGITRARGHSGDNEGAGAVLALAAGERPAVARYPVFGCALFDPGTADKPDDEASEETQ